MISPIQTRRHWIQMAKFAVADELIEDCDYKFDFKMKHAKCEDFWQVGLSVEFAGKNNSPVNYTGQVTYEGIFDVHPEFPEDKTEDLVRLNGGAILYGAIREHILGITSRSKHGPFELPTIDARMFIQKRKPTEEKSPKLEAS